MQTVNFNCPHCGNLMAVGMNLLGRNVRCPHCKAVVQAPTAAGQPMSSPVIVTPPVKPQEPTPPSPPATVLSSAPTLPQFKLPEKPSEPVESIFGEVHDEDLFGTEQPKPVMPSKSPTPIAPVEKPLLFPPEPTAPAREPASPFADAQTEISAGPAVPMPEIEPEPASDFDPTGQTTETRPAKTGRDSRRTQRPPTVDEAKGGNAFAIILLAYGLLMTIAAGIFGYLTFVKSPEPMHPFNAIPDVFGEYEKANRKQTSLKWMPDPRAEVPANLRVKLGEELVVGDLAVTPLDIKTEVVTAVERFNVGDDKVRPIPPKTLVMSLKVKNRSADTAFYPTDPAFLRRLEPKVDERNGPYTMLEINRQRFYGLFQWPPTGNTRKEFIQGHDANEKLLKPGEENTIFVTVAPKQDVVRDMERVPADQPLVWKVQLRRGLVKHKDESGREGEISATAVIGVTFKKAQIQ